MNSNMLLFVPLCFLLCWMLPVDSMEMSGPGELFTLNQIRVSFSSRLPFRSLPLNMVKDAVDDMYFSCNQTMTQMVKNKYFEKENTSTFWDVWKNASDCANSNLDHKDPGDQALTKDHMQAICVYMSDHEDFYKTFNDHVRNDSSFYGTKFPFHSLHFWLTSAVQILNKNTKCVTTYCRTDLKFAGKVETVRRFGSFASSSKKTTLTHFGNKTCFKITTCSGAYLKHYSAVEGEEEVLIPPYEMFKITAKKKGRDVAQLSDCGVVYVLESEGDLSSLNCKAVN